MIIANMVDICQDYLLIEYSQRILLSGLARIIK